MTLEIVISNRAIRKTVIKSRISSKNLIIMVSKYYFIL